MVNYLGTGPGTVLELLITHTHRTPFFSDSRSRGAIFVCLLELLFQFCFFLKLVGAPILRVLF